MCYEERYRFVRSELVRRGITNESVRKEAGVSTPYLYWVMRGERKGYRVRRVIAARCGLPVEFLWPDTPVQHRLAA